MMLQGLRGATHVYAAAALSWLALAWESQAFRLIALSNAHYDKAEALLEWLDQDPFPLD